MSSTSSVVPLHTFSHGLRAVAVLASLGTTLPAFAGELTPTNFTTLHSATADFNYFSALESGAYVFSLGGPVNAYANYQANSFGSQILGSMGWQCLGINSQDPLTGTTTTLDDVRTFIDFSGLPVLGGGTFTYDIEFNSPTGAVTLRGIPTGASGAWSIVDAGQQTTVFNDAAVVANGRYTVSFTGSWSSETQFLANVLEVSTGIIPAPGAVALLGLAGLAGRRRR